MNFIATLLLTLTLMSTAVFAADKPVVVHHRKPVVHHYHHHKPVVHHHYHHVKPVVHHGHDNSPNR